MLKFSAFFWNNEAAFIPKFSDITTAFDFKDYIGPESIHIGEDTRDGTAYISCRFRCKWDVDHGLDIIIHKERVIEITPETDSWKINKDNGTYEQELKEYPESMNVPRRAKQKKWWQFGNYSLST